MPELAEVQTLVDQLKVELQDATIQEFIVHHPGLLQVGNPRGLSGKQILDIQRWGKRMQFILSPNPGSSEPSCLVVGLGMTGGWIWGTQPTKHCIAEIHTNQGDAWYVDPRKFGKMHFFSTMRSAYEALGPRIGVDALAKLNDKQLAEALGSSDIKLKAALLDQSRLAGIGNYLADEIAWDSQLSPLRPLKSLSPDDWSRLNKARTKIIRRALKAQGLSFSDYRHADGSKGDMLSHLRAYGRSGKECLRCGGILQKSVVAGRGTHWCPACQN